MATRMQQRRATAEQWLLADPILAAGEIGYETDTRSFKIGDGINTFSLLDYFETSASIVEGTLDDYVPLTQKGAALGVATLDGTGQVPAEQLANATVDLTGYATETYVDTAEADAISTAATDATTKSATAETNAKAYTDDLIGDGTVDGTTGNTVTDRISSAVSALVDSAPATLDTLNELAAALSDDASFATTVTNSLAEKAPLASPTFTGTVDFSSATVQGLEIPQPLHPFSMIG